MGEVRRVLRETARRCVPHDDEPGKIADQQRRDADKGMMVCLAEQWVDDSDQMDCESIDARPAMAVRAIIQPAWCSAILNALL